MKKFFQKIRKDPFFFFLSGFTGMAVCFSIACRWFNFLLLPRAEKIVFLILIVLLGSGLGWLVYRLFNHYRTKFLARSITLAGLVGMLVVCLLFFWLAPYQFPIFPVFQPAGETENVLFITGVFSPVDPLWQNLPASWKGILLITAGIDLISAIILLAGLSMIVILVFHGSRENQSRLAWKLFLTGVFLFCIPLIWNYFSPAPHNMEWKIWLAAMPGFYLAITGLFLLLRWAVWSGNDALGTAVRIFTLTWMLASVAVFFLRYGPPEFWSVLERLELKGLVKPVKEGLDLFLSPPMRK